MPEALVSHGFLVVAIGMSHDPHAIFDMTRSGLNRIQQGLSIYDADLKLAVSNRRFQEMFGLPDELTQLGADFAQTIRFLVEAGEYGEVDDIDQFVQERVNQALTFEPHYVERTRASGMVISIEGSPVRQGGWVTVYTDITPIKRQEDLLRGHSAQLSDQLLTRSEELAGINRKLAATNSALESTKRDLTESEARTRVTAEMTPAHIARVGKDRRYTYSNRKLPSILPDAQADIVGLSVETALGAEAFAHVSPHLDAAYEGVASVFEFEVQGGSKRIRSAFTPDVDEDGSVTGVYLLSTDVTEEAQARVALVQARKRELAAQLANGLAHDFSNLLTIIVGLQSQIERREDVPDAVKSLVSTTKGAALRGGDLLDRLADISGARGVSPSPVRIDALFANLGNLAPAAVPETVDLTLDNQCGDISVLLDLGYTQDALLNLILNASDAMDGAGQIAITARTKGDAWLEFDVSDGGPGFTQTALERGIDPFFTTKGYGKGSGLGLTMVYDFAKLSGGRVQLSNLETSGAQVMISIPLEVADMATEPGLILLVEDREDLRLSIREILRDQGHAVLEADTAEEALQLAAVPHISCVLSDIMLGGEMTGFDLARALEAKKSGIPIRMITGLASSDPLRQEVARHYPVLRKPFSPEELEVFLKAGND